MNYIKIGAAVLLSAVMVFTLAASLTAAEAPLSGDVNGDGTVTVMDATLIQRVLAHREQPRDGYDAAGDVDSDGGVTIADATLIQRYVAKMIPALPFDPYAPTVSPTVSHTASPTDSDGWGTIIIRP